MDLAGNRRGMSSEVLKIAAAAIIGLAVFAILIGFAAGPQGAQEDLSATGGNLLDYVNDTAARVLDY